MRNDSDRLQWQTEKNYIMNTFHNGLRRIQTDSKTAQQYVLLCLALAVAALIMVSGGSGEDVISVVFRPFVNFIRVIAWLAECLGVIYLFGYIPHSWSYYDDFSRAGICNQAHEAPLLVKANRDGNIQQLTFSLKGCPLEYWEDNRTTIESALNVTVLSITQGSNNQLFDLRVVAGCNLMGRQSRGQIHIWTIAAQKSSWASMRQAFPLALILASCLIGFWLLPPAWVRRSWHC